MFHSSSSSSPYDDPAFCCAAGPAQLTGTLNPYAAAAAFFDGTAAASTASHTLSSSYPSHNYFMHRSSSIHSFANPDLAPGPFFPSSSPPSACDLLDFQFEPVRRVFSTGDLQASTENCIQEGAATAGRVGRYTAEERMKRIERYRSKRNQRNFHKKITYACRKTLADSRPRVRGRFARNGEMETETEPEVEAEASASEISYDSYNNHPNNNNNNNNDNCTSFSNYDNGGGNDGEWWRQMQAALTTTDEEEECCYDEDIWASYDSVFSLNLLS